MGPQVVHVSIESPFHSNTCSSVNHASKQGKHRNSISRRLPRQSSFRTVGVLIVGDAEIDFQVVDFTSTADVKTLLSSLKTQNT